MQIIVGYVIRRIEFQLYRIRDAQRDNAHIQKNGVATVSQLAVSFIPEANKMAAREMAPEIYENNFLT